MIFTSKPLNFLIATHIASDFLKTADIYWSGITLWVSNTGYLFIVAPVSQWETLESKWTFVFKVDFFQAGKMGIKIWARLTRAVMARQLGQSMSKIAAVVGCSLTAAVSIYEKWAKEGTVVN